MPGPGDLLPPARILLGPGPTAADPRVLRAMATPLLGQFDPAFTAIMNEVMALSRQVFRTANARTFPVSGTGRAGLEAVLVSLLEPGDRVVVGECGRFGLLLIEIAERCGAEVVAVRGEWGRVIEPDAIEAAVRGGPTRLVAVIHGETSTGVLQPLEDLADAAHAHGALLVADCVVTLGGCEVAVDAWGLDVAVAGTQKCLSCPSGLAPVTYNDAAARLIAARRTRPRSNYLDLGQLADYWSPGRFNHHTASTSMVYGLREALRAVLEEGLALFGKEAPERRLPFITPVVVPDGVDDLRVRRRLLEEFGIEIGAAFGPLQGKIWRIGTMGWSARRANVLLCLAALESVLGAEGFRTAPGAGVGAALAHYRSAGGHASAGDDDGLGAAGNGRA